MIAQIVANVALDVEEIIRDISRDSETPISEITMDDIFDYVNSGVSYISGNKPGISSVEDGWSLERFDDSTYNEIEKILTEMQSLERM